MNQRTRTAAAKAAVVVALVILASMQALSASSLAQTEETSPTIIVSGEPFAEAGKPYELDIAVDGLDPKLIASWTVSWGDGTTDTKKNAPDRITHTYDDAGPTRPISVSILAVDGTVYTNADLVLPEYDQAGGLTRRDPSTATILADLGAAASRLDAAHSAIVGPDGLLYVSDNTTNAIHRFDPADNTQVDVFVTSAAAVDAGLSGPTGLAFTHDGDLLVASSRNGQILSFDGTNGSFDAIAATGTTLRSPSAILVESNGDILVADAGDDDIERFSGTTGAHLGTFAQLNPGSSPAAMASSTKSSVLVALSGHGRVVTVSEKGEVEDLVSDLTAPSGVALGPDGAIWISDYWTDTIQRFDAETGKQLAAQLVQDGPHGPRQFTFLPDVQVSVVAIAPKKLTAKEWSDRAPKKTKGKDLVFEANTGEAEAELDFLAQADDYVAIIADTGVELAIDDSAAPVEMQLVNAAAKEPSAVSSETAVAFDDIYTGIDVVYSANGSELEYSFIIEPGSDPSDIRLDFAGVDGVSITETGDLRLDSTSGPELLSTAPISFQDIDGIRVPVTSSYLIRADGSVGFSLGAFDASRPLVIDPTFIVASTATADATSIVVGRPAGVAAGDVLVAQLTVDKNTPTVTPPSGWIFVRSDDFVGKVWQAIYYKVATGSEPVSYTFNFASVQKAIIGVGSYRGVNTASPIDAHSGAVIPKGSPFTAPSVTTTVSGTTLLAFFGNNGGLATTPPPSMIERWDIAAVSAGAAADEQFVGIGTTGSRTATFTNNEKVAQMVALAPAPSGSTVTVNSTRNNSDASAGNGFCATGSTNTQGAAECTLRAAIEEANASTVVNTIRFNIPTTETGYEASPVAFRIRPTGTILPDITRTVTIDGTSQPQFTTAGRPVIALDGTIAPTTGDPNGLSLNAGSSVIRGLVIQSFGEDGIEIDVNGNNVISGNYIGTDVTGTLARPNGHLNMTPVAGISVKTDGNSIGGTSVADRNVISGNTQSGVVLRSGADNNVVIGNYIGTTANGTAARPNGTDGVNIQSTSTGNRIGGAAAGSGNTIAFNTSKGVVVVDTASANTAIIGNRIHSNGALGIDLANNGVTANSNVDAWLNYPVATAAAETAGTVAVNFTLDVPAGSYRIEAFTNPMGADPTGNGEGQIFNSSTTIAHMGSGVEAFQITYPGSGGDIVSLTATRQTAGPTYVSTSEFSAAATAVANSAPVAVDDTPAAGVNYGVARGGTLTLNLSNVFLTKWGTVGTGNSQFNRPAGIAVDASGNVYVADTENGRIQKFTSTGTYITQWGTTGPANGQFKKPLGIAVDAAGNVYVADTENGRIQKFTSTGTYITQWGTTGPANGQFNRPAGITVDTSGNVYVADTSNHRIQKFTSTGTYITQWGTSGTGNSQFNLPAGITVDTSGNVYVADTSNHRIQKFTSTGTYITQWGTLGAGNGQFNRPADITVDRSGNIYVADTSNHRIQKFTSTGTYITQWGTSGTGNSQFNRPAGITVDTSGNIYVADTENHRIQKFGVVGSILANDTDADLDPITVFDENGAVAGVQSTSGTSFGTLTLNTNGTFSYTNDGSANNLDMFTYRATDSFGQSNIATVEIAITPFLPSPTVTVNSTRNTGDSNIGNHICSTGSTNTQGAPECTLRAAIEEANASTVVNTIEFAIPTTETGYVGGIWTITPTAALPLILRTVAVDARTQTGYSASPLVRLDGVSTTGGTGFTVGGAADGSQISGLQINRFDVDGINVTTGASAVTISDNWIGSDGTGATTPGNDDDGLDVNGGNAIIDGNVVNNSGDEGIDVRGFGATITGNIVGLEADGTTGAGNTDVGIAVFAPTTTIGGNTPAERNVVSMNFEGIEINTPGNVITGNYIGTDAGGTLDRGNRIGDGIEVLFGSNRIGGTAPGEGNVVAFNQIKGIDITSGNDNTILGNNIHSNGALGIDRAGGTENGFGVTTNGTGGVNNGLQHPVPTAAIEAAGTVTVDFTLDALAGNYRVEAFTNPGGADPSGNGEGESYETAATVSHTGSGTESFQIAYTGLAGDIVSLTATEELSGPVYGSSSEFSLAVTSTATASAEISGTVFEDIVGNVLADGAVGGVNNPGADAVDVYLYLDDGDTNLDAGDTLIGGAPIQTDASGDYSFTGLSDGDYFVVVDSKTVPSSVDPTAVQGQIWAEQTWGPVGGYCATGGAGFQIRVAAGPCYAGITGSISDDFSQWDDREHRSALTVSGGDITDIDFGFSFNVVTGVNGGNAIDHDPANPRTVQGSLRQFIQNANAIAGSNVMRHVPATGPGAVGVWTIAISNQLPSITNGGTTIDGTAHELADGVTVLDTNPSGPELQLDGSSSINATGLTITSANNTIRNMIVSGFSDSFYGGILLLGAGADNNVISGNYVGTDRVGGASNANYYGIRISTGAGNNTIGGLLASDRNVISGNSEAGVSITGAGADFNLIRGNYIGTNAAGTGPVGNGDGIELASSVLNTTIGGTGANSRNVISGNSGQGIFTSADSTFIWGNYIGTNAAGTGPVGNVRGIWLSGSTGSQIGAANPLQRNVISGNMFRGVLVANSSTGNTVAGNYIGTDAAGTGSIPNSGPGVELNFTSTGNTIGGTAPDAGNLIANNSGRGILTLNSSTGNSILRNNIWSNGALGIDLDNDGITPNSPTDASLDYPLITGAIESAGTVTVNFDLDVPAGNYHIEAFTNPSGADPSGNGEGESYETATAIIHTGSGTESFQIAYTGTTGDIVSLTATEEAAGPIYSASSEFSANATVTASNDPPTLDPVGAQSVNETVLLAFTATASDIDVPAQTLTFSLEDGTDTVPTGAAITASGGFTWTPTEAQGGATYSFKIRVTDDGTGTLFDEEEVVFTVNEASVISGTVFEDIAGDLLADGAIATAANPGSVGVDVHLWAGAGSPIVASTVTDSFGKYVFSGLSDGDYTVFVDSKTVPSAQDPTAVQGDIWAEQTYGPLNASCANGSGSSSANVGAGSCYSGSTSTLSDTIASPLHRSGVTVSGADVAAVDFGFSFNVVVGTRGGDATDDDGTANRTVQGSLRQFIQNANAIAGPNDMRFVPTDPTNASIGADEWWSMATTSPLPTITDDQTTVDGRAYDLFDGITIRDTNAAQIGAARAVGTLGTYTTPSLDPELEIWNDRGAAVLPTGLVFEASDAVLRHVAIWGFGDSSGTFDTNVRFGTNFNTTPDFTGSLVEFNVFGTSPASFSDPGGGLRTGQKNLTMRETDNAIVRDNLIGFAGGVGIDSSSASTAITVLRNEIRRNGILNPAGNPVGVWMQGDVIGNLVIDNASGITSGSAPQIDYLDNTIEQNGWGATRPNGIHIFASPAIVQRNVIRDNFGAGTVIQSNLSSVVVSRNSFSGNGTGNGQIGIDLLTAGDDPSTSPFITLNDNNDADAGANTLLNYPVIDTAELVGSDLVITGWVSTGAGVELYIADADPSGFGEGTTWLATMVEGSVDDTDPIVSTYGPGAVNGLLQGTDTTDRFEFTMALASLPVAVAAGDDMTALTLTSQTSEFGGVATVTGAFTVNSTGDAPDTSPGDGVCTTGNTNSQGEAECTLRAAIEETDVLPGADSVNFNMPASEAGHAGGVWTIAPASQLPPLNQTTILDATTQKGWANTPIVEIDGAGAGLTTDGFRVYGDSSEIRGFAVNGFDGDGIKVYAGTADVVIQSNHVGLDATGLIDRGNGGRGIDLQNTSGPTTIGGTLPIQRNVISGNADDGIVVWGSNDNIIIGNYIGTDVTGLASGLGIGNGSDGVAFGNGSSGNTIGQAGSGNVFSGNGRDGVEIDGASPSNTIQGNFIGVGRDGASVLGNGRHGIVLFNGANLTQIGGTLAGEENVISSNATDGIVIDGNSNAITANNSIVGNLIGTDLTGLLPRGNGDDGISIFDGANNNTIGGASKARGNVISNNGSDGVSILDAGSTGNAVIGNETASNGNLGIDFDNDGVTPNDVGDADSGANDLLNHPEIASATLSGTIVTIAGTYDVPAGDYRFEFFKNPSGADPSGNGEGELLVGVSTLSHSGAGPLGFGGAFPGAMGDQISVTITEVLAGPIYRSTSEFSATVQVTGPIVVNSTGDAADASAGDGACDTGALNSEGDPECTIRAAIHEVNASTLLDTIDFAIPDSDSGYQNLGAGNSYWTIQPSTSLPVLVHDNTTMDGTSQATYASGQGYFTNSFGPSIELEGSVAGATGLEIAASNATLRGIVINRFSAGVALTAGDNNSIVGSYIGPDITGLVGEVGNTSHGIYIYGATNTTIGGASAGDRNVISGNRQRGVWIDDWTDGAPAISNGTAITGNYIGTDADGATALSYDTSGATQQMGIALWNGPNNIFGGPGPTDGNVISGNSWHGVYVWGAEATGNTVQGNVIGLDAKETFPVGNGSDNPLSRSGLIFSSAPGNLIGGPNPTDGNVIAGNDAAGAAVTFSVGNTFLGNEFYDNSGIALDLGLNGITSNDAGDVDTGPNDYLNHPIVTGGSELAGIVTVDFDLDVPAGDYRIEIYTNPSGPDPSGQGEGEVYENGTQITHTGSGVESFQITYTGSGAELVTLTNTEEAIGPVYGSTSEFSVAVAAGSSLVNSTGDAPDANIGDDICDTGALNADGDRECTLRAAIDESNASTIVDEIDFAIPATDSNHLVGLWTIAPSTALPSLMRGVNVDGSTQPGYLSSPNIRLNGSTAPAASNGFTIGATGDGSTVQGFAVVNFPDDGIEISGAASAIVVSDNFIGLEPDGVTAAPNADDGVDDNGSANLTISNNVVSANGGAGMQLEGSVATITGNKIGVSADGLTARGNGADGVLVRNGASSIAIGGTGAADGNTIANNGGVGIALDAVVPASNITILGNSVSGNTDLGIDLAADGPTPNDAGDVDPGPNDLLNYPEIINVQRVAGELIVDLTLDVPAGNYRVELFGNSVADGSGYGEGESPFGFGSIAHTGSGPETFTVSGTSQATIVSTTTTEDLGAGNFGPTSEFSLAVPSPDLVIVNSTGDGVDAILGDGQCETSGTNIDGNPECTLRAAIEELNDATTPVDTIWFAIPTGDPGHTGGVWTIAPTSGMPTVNRPATIDGSTQPGHILNSTTAPAALDGTQAIFLDGAAAGTTAGLTLLADDVSLSGIVIAGFDGNGVELSGARATVSNVYVGTRVNGATADPNFGHGLLVTGANATIGGTAPGDRVLISGNDQQGVELAAPSATILGSIIGLDATVSIEVANGRNGIRMNGAIDAVIGIPGAGNVVAGNNIAAGAADGIFIAGGGGHTIQSNLIGTNLAGATLGNFNAGIAVDSATDVTIGGVALGEGNSIAHNGGDGVQVTGASSTVTSLGNEVWSNGRHGFDLNNDGTSLNDPGDTDGGPNNLLNTPVLGTASVSGGVVTVDFALDVPAGTYRVEFFTNAGGADPSGSGEGETIVASASMSHAGAGSQASGVTFTGAQGAIISATATEELGAGSYGVTSEYSGTITALDVALSLLDDQSVRRSDVLAAGGLDIVADSAPGHLGTAIDFDGSNDRLLGPALDVTDNALTIQAWVNPDTLIGQPHVVSKVNAGGTPIYELFIDAGTGEAAASVRVGGSTVTARGGTVSVGTWHLLAAVWDGSELAVNVDGVEVDRVAASGTLATDVATNVVLGNNSASTQPFDGLIDDIRISHVATPSTTLGSNFASATSSIMVSVGAEQTSTPGAWSTSGVQTRSGSFALAAPQTSGSGAAAWAVATGIDEPGLVFESWWWFSSDTGIDLASGTRAGSSPTDEYEAALTSPTGWELRQRNGASGSFDAPAAGSPTSGVWMNVEIRTDQFGATRLFIDDVEVTTATPQGSALLSGSMALRAGLLPTGQNWFIDDARGRKLVTPEPLASVGPLDRN